MLGKESYMKDTQSLIKLYELKVRKAEIAEQLKALYEEATQITHELKDASLKLCDQMDEAGLVGALNEVTPNLTLFVARNWYEYPDTSEALEFIYRSLDDSPLLDEAA